MLDAMALERRQRLERGLDWAARRTFDGAAYSPARVAELKGDRTVSVVIPVKEAALTVGRRSPASSPSSGVVSRVVGVKTGASKAGPREESGWRCGS